jgi:hypothetical protein
MIARRTYDPAAPHPLHDHGCSISTAPKFRMPIFKYTGEAKVLMSVNVDMQAEIFIVGQPENGAYEWVIVNEIVGGYTVEQHSDCGYGQRSIALRDGLIAYHGLEQPHDAAPELLKALRRVLDEWEFKRAVEANRNKDVTPQWVYDARAAIAKAEKS